MRKIRESSSQHASRVKYSQISQIQQILVELPDQLKNDQDQVLGSSWDCHGQGQWPGKEPDTLPGATWEVGPRSWRFRGLHWFCSIQNGFYLIFLKVQELWVSPGYCSHKCIWLCLFVVSRSLAEVFEKAGDVTDQ